MNPDDATLAATLDRAGRRYGDKTAIFCGPRVWSYADLDRHAGRVAGCLAANGVAPGTSVGLRCGAKDLFLATMFGLIRAGVVAVPVDRDDAEGQRFLLADSGATLVVDDGSLREGAVPTDCRVFGLNTIEDFEPAPVQPVNPADPAVILYTSGTLGRRKGVVVTQVNLQGTAAYIVSFMGLDETVVELVASPVDHAFGFGRCRSVLAVGGTLVLDEQPFSPFRALALLERQDCNAFGGAASSMAMLVQHFGKPLAKLAGRLRWMELGSVPMAPVLLERLGDILPGCRIVMNYGMTEAQRSTMIDFSAEGRTGTVGRASPGCAVRVRDADGVCLPSGAPGIIEVKGPHVAAGYHNAADLWARRMRDGWFATDDMGSLDADGYLTYIGRVDDMINLGGDKISPLEIEHAIAGALGDQVFAVCAARDPDGLYGDIPVLCLESDGRPLPALAELRAAGGDDAARILPRRVAMMTELPRTGNGKVQRKQLRRWLEDGTVVMEMLT